METLHDEIHWLTDQAREKILEAERYYSNVCLDIFEDEECERFLPIDIVVDNFKNNFVQFDDEEDIQ